MLGHLLTCHGMTVSFNWPWRSTRPGSVRTIPMPSMMSTSEVPTGGSAESCHRCVVRIAVQRSQDPSIHAADHPGPPAVAQNRAVDGCLAHARVACRHRRRRCSKMKMGGGFPGPGGKSSFTIVPTPREYPRVAPLGLLRSTPKFRRLRIQIAVHGHGNRARRASGGDQRTLEAAVKSAGVVAMSRSGPHHRHSLWLACDN